MPNKEIISRRRKWLLVSNAVIFINILYLFLSSFFIAFIGDRNRYYMNGAKMKIIRPFLKLWKNHILCKYNNYNNNPLTGSYIVCRVYKVSSFPVSFDFHVNPIRQALRPYFSPFFNCRS